MKFTASRRAFLKIMAYASAWCAFPARGQNAPPGIGGQRGGGGGGGGRGRRENDDYILPADLNAYSILSLVLGRVTDRSITVSAISKETAEGFYEYGIASGKYTHKTDVIGFPAGEAVETALNQLQPDTRYFYRLQWHRPGDPEFTPRPECRFHTQRSAGSTFTFTIQGDSHPERPFMSDPNLYARTLQLAAASQPDFHICMGDDFSVETLREYSQSAVTQRYTLQRPFLGLIAQSAPVFLLNGNHEQASLFNFNQTGIPHDVSVWAQNARNRLFPTIAPDQFYTGNTEPMKSIGQLKDYYAWTWGDALFVVLDNYWHAPVQVDTPLGGGGGGGGGGGNNDPGKENRDWWALTLGDAQYQWFKRTLEQSKAKYKFVLAHHVLGSGRGGVDECDLWEWGGNNKRGDFEFTQKRPGWELPVHQLMAKHGVTIFFQGHDHLFARQEKDGIVYQEVPMPADQGYVAYNEDRYQSGVKLPNSGYLRVSVSQADVKVDYIRSYLPKDETDQRKTGEIAHSYTVSSKATHA